VVHILDLGDEFASWYRVYLTDAGFALFWAGGGAEMGRRLPVGDAGFAYIERARSLSFKA
jgi:hypothetical protein